MMKEKNWGVVLFYSTSAAIRAEKVALEAGLAVKLIPVPRHLSADCGVALRFAWGDRAEVEELLKAMDVPFDSIHRL